jgi:hypothetical protein
LTSTIKKINADVFGEASEVGSDGGKDDWVQIGGPIGGWGVGRGGDGWMLKMAQISAVALLL